MRDTIVFWVLTALLPFLNPERYSVISLSDRARNARYRVAVASQRDGQSKLAMTFLTMLGLSVPPDALMHRATSSCIALSEPFFASWQRSGNCKMMLSTSSLSGMHCLRPTVLITCSAVSPVSAMISATCFPILALITLSLIRSNTCRMFSIVVCSFFIVFLI